MTSVETSMTSVETSKTIVEPRKGSKQLEPCPGQANAPARRGCGRTDSTGARHPRRPVHVAGCGIETPQSLLEGWAPGGLPGCPSPRRGRAGQSSRPGLCLRTGCGPVPRPSTGSTAVFRACHNISRLVTMYHGLSQAAPPLQAYRPACVYSAMIVLRQVMLWWSNANKADASACLCR